MRSRGGQAAQDRANTMATAMATLCLYYRDGVDDSLIRHINQKIKGKSLTGIEPNRLPCRPLSIRILLVLTGHVRLVLDPAQMRRQRAQRRSLVFLSSSSLLFSFSHSVLLLSCSVSFDSRIDLNSLS